MSRSRKLSQPSAAAAEREHRAAVEARAKRDYEAATGLPWSEVTGGGKAERLAIAEADLRREAALDNAPPADHAPAPSPSPAPAGSGWTADSIRTFARSIGPVIRQAIEDRARPLGERALALETRLAQAEARLAALETAMAAKGKGSKR